MEFDGPASIHGSCLSVWATRAATGVPRARDAFPCGSVTSAKTFVYHYSPTPWSYVGRLHKRTQGTPVSASVKSARVAPRHWRVVVHTSRADVTPSHTGMRPERAAHPWRREWPKLRDNCRVLRLGHHVLYTHHLPWPGDQPGRPSWPWKCAHVRCRSLLGMTPWLLAHGYIHVYMYMSRAPSVPVVVGHCFMNVWTHSDQWEPLYHAGGALL